MSVKKHRGVNVDFWTDEKVVSLSPLARLMFLGSWHYCCDGGHLDATPLELKLKVLPADNCDPVELVEEILAAGDEERGRLMIRDEQGLLSIPKLPEHQKIDKRYAIRCERCEDHESPTSGPPEKPASTTREPRVEPEGSRAEGDGDGDGEGDGVDNTAPRKRGSRIPDIFPISEAMSAWAAEKAADVDIEHEHEVFCDYWRGRAGALAVKVDWPSTWRNWMRKAQKGIEAKKPQGYDPELPDWMQA